MSHRYLVFPVKVDPSTKEVKSRPTGQGGYETDATNYEDAFMKGSTHVPLFEGEQLAVVVVGKATEPAPVAKA